VNILGMGPMEALLIIILALIVFGPARLPEIMGQVGKAINDFRRATSDLSDEFNKTIQAELNEGRSVFEETRAAVTDVHSTVNSAVAGASMPAPAHVGAPGEPAPVANGTGAEPFREGGGNGASAEPMAPLAEATPWSWETSAPASAPAAAAGQEPGAPTPEASGPAHDASGPGDGSSAGAQAAGVSTEAASAGTEGAGGSAQGGDGSAHGSSPTDATSSTEPARPAGAEFTEPEPSDTPSSTRAPGGRDEVQPPY
jgi:sec-independent protein translocase protein TatB